MSTKEEIKDKNLKEVKSKKTKSKSRASKSKSNARNMSVEENEVATNSKEAAHQEEALKEQLEESKNKYMRLYSEFENFRRRTSKERQMLITSANKDLLTALLPILDDFDRAMLAKEAKTNEHDTFFLGVQLIQQKFQKILKYWGLTKIDLSKGDNFDEEYHEAVTQIPVEKELEGKIVNIIEPGYKVSEKMVRFAKVVVGSKQ